MWGEKRQLNRIERKIDALLLALNILIVEEEEEEHQPKFARLTFEGGSVPKTITVGGTAQAVFTEFDQFNQPITGPGPVGFTSSDPAIATVDANGACFGVAAGTATIVGLDSGDNLTASDVLTVEAPVPVPTSATLVLQ